MEKKNWLRLPGGLVLAAAAALAAAPFIPASRADAALRWEAAGLGAPEAVVVQADPGGQARAKAAVVRLGGSVGRPLRIINGFSARVRTSALPALRRAPGVRAVTRDMPVAPLMDFASSSTDISSTDISSTDGTSSRTLATTTAAYDPSADPYSMYKTTLGSGAREWWRKGYTGKGIDIAVIDTGVAPVDGLRAPGKVLYGPDLSLESQASNLRNLDTFGHGTFMAGLIAGRDDGASSNLVGDKSSYLGMAPNARIVSVKVATADGGTDVSQVIAAIDWVVQHAKDPGLNIRVISLSFGTNSVQPYEVDPLAFAVEQAWKRGIVVVAAAGNSGYQRSRNAPGLANPAYHPLIIGVGGADSMGTSTIADDIVGSFSASAAIAGAKRPDFMALGAHLQGLRAPNSYVDARYPGARLGQRFFRGSGTSQAAAIAAGAVALVLEKHPTFSPDEVKSFLVEGATKLSDVFNVHAQGAGEINLASMLTQTRPSTSGPSPRPSTGDGSLEGSRGTDHISRDGIVLSGEKDIFGKTFDSAAMARAEAAGNSWTGGVWNGSSWTGNSWTGNSWTGSSWSGSSWSGSSWSGSSWSGNSWSGSSWSGNSWSGSSWSGNSWSGSSWSTGGWN